MRKIINSTYISLDGVVEGPHLWPALPGGGRGPLGDALQSDLLMACDAMLMGRRTYDGFASVWPTRAGDPDADRINAMAKYVVSSSLRDPTWNNTTVIHGDVVGQVRRLKEQPGQDIVRYGFGEVSSLLMDHGLLDEIRLWLFPLYVGKGGPTDLMFRQVRPTTFELGDVKTLRNGIVVLTYRNPEAAT